VTGRRTGQHRETITEEQTNRSKKKTNSNQPPSLLSLDLWNQRQGNKTKETEAKEETQRGSPE
jgi:hypothetical protein